MRQLVIEKNITNRETMAVKNYLQDISKLPMVTPEQEAELAKRIRKGDEKALETLVNANLRFVVSVAKQYQHLGVPLEDLISEGNAGLIKAAKRFDETKGFKFISFAVWWIRQAILKASADHERQIRLPQNQIVKLGQIKKTRAKLEQELERDPTGEEMGEVMELTGVVVEQTLTAAINPASMDQSYGDDDDFTLGDLLQDEEMEAADEAIIITSLRDEILSSLNVLSDREKTVIEHYFGIGGKEQMTVNQLARKIEIAVTTVYQIRDRALKKLRKSGSANHLKNYLAS